MDAHELLDRSRRCLLALPAPDGPFVAPMAHWSDGAHLWMASAASPLRSGSLHDAPCAAMVAAEGGSPTVTVRGTARTFRAADPVGALLHGPAIAGAMAALAASQAPALGSYLQDAARAPSRWAPQNRVAVRLRLDAVALVEPPVPPPGVAPALPTVVPSDVRRVLGGRRQVAVVVEAERLEVLPAAWGAGFSLLLPSGRHLRPGARVTVVVDDAPTPPPDAVGLALRGRVTPTGALAPERATWWEGFDVRSAEVPRSPAAASGIVLPD